MNQQFSISDRFQQFSISDRFQMIENWDFSDVEFRLVEKDGLPPSDVRTAVTEFKRYMYLRLSRGVDQLPMPSRLVDEVWHQFILFTQDYHDFCNAVFGKYVHHQPTTESRQPTTEAIKFFFEIYQAEFGELPSIWDSEATALTTDCYSE